MSLFSCETAILVVEISPPPTHALNNLDFRLCRGPVPPAVVHHEYEREFFDFVSKLYRYEPASAISSMESYNGLVRVGDTGRFDDRCRPLRANSEKAHGFTWT
jgi:hypothetical protein